MLRHLNCKRRQKSGLDQKANRPPALVTQLQKQLDRQTDDKGCSFSLLSEGTSLYMTVSGNEL